MKEYHCQTKSQEGLYQKKKISENKETGNSSLCTNVAERTPQLVKRHHRLVLSLIPSKMLPAVREDRYVWNNPGVRIKRRSCCLLTIRIIICLENKVKWCGKSRKFCTSQCEPNQGNVLILPLVVCDHQFLLKISLFQGIVLHFFFVAQIKYSVMLPGTHVWPHTGPTNCRLRLHLGLVIPKNVAIRVGRETR